MKIDNKSWHEIFMRISMNSYKVPKFFSSLKLGDQHDAIEELMSLSPYEMRNLLHHIMAGDEFHIDVQNCGIFSEEGEIFIPK